MRRIRIATRRSRLAMTQTQFVASLLKVREPALQVELVRITSQGDRDQSPSLAQAGGKSSFVGALEEAVRDGRADLAVHSMKDVAVRVPDEFALHTFGPRADVRDALVANGTAVALTALPCGARVGTASIRRRALLLTLRRDLEVVPVRGNVDTRLDRLDAGGYHALLLACAGLDRLGLGERIGQRVDAGVLVPAPGQGALAVEYLAGREDLDALVRTGVDREVERAVAAERQVTWRLGADCAMPFGAFCAVRDGELALTTVAADPDGTRMLRVELSGDDPVALGDDAAARLRKLGVGDLLGTRADDDG
ncbi:MAG: hydroxymethylbilane synthase [Gammaproteobacteria bacterium]|nr:hydroxymethylbilane synthase [Gammaproteobacteria bacterium]